MPYKVDVTNASVRRKWVMEALKSQALNSPFAHLMGNSYNSPIHSSNTSVEAAGHYVVFQTRQGLEEKAIRGSERAAGKGETKKVFNEQVTVDRFRHVVDNGDKFNSIEIGDLSLSQHGDSIKLLGEKFFRWRDQVFFDTLQSNMLDCYNRVQNPTHRLEFEGEFGYNELITIPKHIRTGMGFLDPNGGEATRRTPLMPLTTNDYINPGVHWVMYIDPHVYAKVKLNADWKDLLMNIDQRGKGSKIISGVLGQIDSIMFVQMPLAASEIDNEAANWNIEDITIQACGMRTRDGSGKWLGQEGYNDDTKRWSRCFIVGANAIKYGLGMAPDYKFRMSDDFGITSESMLETWFGLKKARYNSIFPDGDWSVAPIGGVDHGVITVDIETTGV